MNILSILTILSICLICGAAPVLGGNYELLLNLLPIYGSTKLSSILTPRTLSKTMVNILAKVFTVVKSKSFNSKYSKKIGIFSKKS